MAEVTVKSNTASASQVQAQESVCLAEDRTMLCSVPLQGDIGPPGAEGEQGQEGMRVSDCKKPTNPFLPSVWVNLTQAVYLLLLYFGNKM